MWTKLAIELLITKYKEHDNLYNARNPMYMERLKRSQSLDDICKHLKKLNNSITVEDIRKKIHYLRGQYLKESYTIQSHRRNAPSEEDLYKPKLWYYDKLVFLEPHVCRRNQDATTNEYNEDEFSSDVSNKQSAHHHHTNTQFNGFDESGIKLEVSVEENSENSTLHFYNNRLNESDEITIDKDATTNIRSEPPTQESMKESTFATMGKTCDKSQNDKRKRYITKIKSDPQKLKILREKAAERMRKLRLALTKNKKVLEQTQEKERTRMKEYRQKKKNEDIYRKMQGDNNKITYGKITNEYNEDKISSDVSNKQSVHHQHTNTFNGFDESSIKLEVSVEANSENSTVHLYNNTSNECNEKIIEDNISTEEKIKPPTQKPPPHLCCKERKRTSESDEQLDDVKRLLVKQFDKNNDYDWLGKQVVFEMKSIRNKKIQRETAWKIQMLLREASIEDEAISECQSKQFSMELNCGTQSSCGSCCSNNKQQTNPSLLSAIRNSDSMDRSFSS